MDFTTKITKDGGQVEIHLDVESSSLRGFGFAFGAIVRQGNTVLAERSLIATEGEALCGDWVRENVLPHLGDLPRVFTLNELYETFWTLYSSVRAAVVEAPWLQAVGTRRSLRGHRGQRVAICRSAAPGVHREGRGTNSILAGVMRWQRAGA